MARVSTSGSRRLSDEPRRRAARTRRAAAARDTIERDPRQRLVGRRGWSLHERHRQRTGRFGAAPGGIGVGSGSTGRSAFGLDQFGSHDGSRDATGSASARSTRSGRRRAFERRRPRIDARRDLVEHRVPVRRRGRQRRGGGPRQRRRRRTIELDRHPRTDAAAPREHHEGRDHQMDGGRRRERPQRADEGAGERHRMRERQRQRGRETETGVHAARGYRPAKTASRPGCGAGRPTPAAGRRPAAPRSRPTAARPGRGRDPARTARWPRPLPSARHDQRAKDPSDANPVTLPGHRYTACSSSGRLFFA